MPKKGPATRPTAGVTLSATAGMASQATFTREQVAYLIHLAFLSGGNARTALDMAEIEGIHDEHPPDPRMTRQQRVAARLADMHERAERARAGKTPHPFWPTLHPGGWPLPAEIPSDNPDDWWPEVDGWPCPPPHLRGTQA